MGLTEAATATANAIRRWRPSYVVLVGIAGGIARNGVALGDVLIADQFADYELAKVTSVGVGTRWRVYPADPRLLLAAQNFTFSPSRLRVARPVKGRKSRVHIGPICTGNKVIADATLSDGFQNVWKKLIGIEMEAGGVASSVTQAVHRPGFFMVRGASDLADGAKDSKRVTRWREYACDIAAAWTIEFLRSGPIPAVDKSAGSDVKENLRQRGRTKPSSRSTQSASTVLARIQSTFPSVNSELFGRKSDLDQITTLLQSKGHSILCLKAIGGMGKTALAKEWCRTHYDEYEEIGGARLTDSEFLVSTDGPQDQLATIKPGIKCLAKREFLAKVGEQLGFVSSQDDEFHEKEIVKRLAGKRTLFLVDNLETDPDASALLASLLKLCQAPTRTALVTTRVLPNVPTNALVSHSLMALDETSSRLLIENWLRERRTQLSGEASAAAIAAIVDIASGHPLALELLSGKLITFGIKSITALRKRWKSDGVGSLSDAAMRALYSFVFDERFHAYLGTPGLDLLRLIAKRPRRAGEVSLQRAFVQIYTDFAGYLQKLFETGCVYRKIVEGRTVLLMHPLTRAYLREIL